MINYLCHLRSIEKVWVMLLLMDPHFSTMKSINGYITIIPVLRYCMLHTIPKVMLAVVANIYKVLLLF